MQVLRISEVSHHRSWKDSPRFMKKTQSSRKLSGFCKCTPRVPRFALSSVQTDAPGTYSFHVAHESESWTACVYTTPSHMEFSFRRPFSYRLRSCPPEDYSGTSLVGFMLGFLEQSRVSRNNVVGLRAMTTLHVEGGFDQTRHPKASLRRPSASRVTLEQRRSRDASHCANRSGSRS